jgi:hypothetical protein
MPQVCGVCSRWLWGLGWLRWVGLGWGGCYWVGWGLLGRVGVTGRVGVDVHKQILGQVLERPLGVGNNHISLMDIYS